MVLIPAYRCNVLLRMRRRNEPCAGLRAQKTRNAWTQQQVEMLLIQHSRCSPLCMWLFSLLHPALRILYSPPHNTTQHHTAARSTTQQHAAPRRHYPASDTSLYLSACLSVLRLLRHTSRIKWIESTMILYWLC